jgi:hypothetical protein
VNKAVITSISVLAVIVAGSSLLSTVHTINQITFGPPPLLTTDEMVGTWREAGTSPPSAISFTNKSTGHGGYIGTVDVLLGVRNQPFSYSFEQGTFAQNEDGTILLSIYTGDMARPNASSAVTLKALDHNTLVLAVLPKRPPLRASPPLFAPAAPIKLLRVYR